MGAGFIHRLQISTGKHTGMITGLGEKVFLPRGWTDPTAHSSFFASPSSALGLVGRREVPTLQEGPSLCFQISGELAVS